MDDAMFRAFAIAGLRSGLVTLEQIDEAAEYAESQGDADTAHQLRCLALRANETPVSDWKVGQRRSRLSIVPNGGNSD